MLAAVGALIAAGVVFILMEGDGPGPLGDATDPRAARRPPPPTAVSRFWQQLWHGKPKSANATAARESLLAEAMAACTATGGRTPTHLVDVKLEIRWGMGDIQQHRRVEVVMPGRMLGSVAVLPPSVNELWRLCTFAATRRDAFNLRCAKDRLFLEVGGGAAGLAMAARGMLVWALTLHADALEDLQCFNGRRLCLARIDKEREKEGKPFHNLKGERSASQAQRGQANLSSPLANKGEDEAAARCSTLLCVLCMCGGGGLQYHVHMRARRANAAYGKAPVCARMRVYRCANSSWWGPFARFHAGSQISRRQERGEVEGEGGRERGKGCWW
jgi:hypothetical protein